MSDTRRLAATSAEQARHAAARHARHLNRRPPSVPPSPLHECYCQDPAMKYSHQLGDHDDVADGAL